MGNLNKVFVPNAVFEELTEAKAPENVRQQIGRVIALNRNLPLSGTLGVLERADRMGLVDDFPQILQELRASGFFIAATLEQRFLKRHLIRKKLYEDH